MLCYNKHFPNNNLCYNAFNVNNTSSNIYHGGRLKYQKSRRGTGPPIEVFACGAMRAGRARTRGVGEVLLDLLGEAPGEVLALPPRSCRRRQ